MGEMLFRLISTRRKLLDSLFKKEFATTHITPCLYWHQKNNLYSPSSLSFGSILNELKSSGNHPDENEYLVMLAGVGLLEEE